MRCAKVTINVDPWLEKVGSKRALQQAWVKISNIPIDKRSERIIAYVGSLVGITLEVDKASIHRHDYVRIRLGCRSVKDLPSVAEGCLGMHFYDFLFEVEQDLSQPKKDGEGIQIGDNRDLDEHISKKAKGTPTEPSLMKGKDDNSCKSAPPKLSGPSFGSFQATLETKTAGKNYILEVDEGDEESEEEGELFLDMLARESQSQGFNGDTETHPSEISTAISFVQVELVPDSMQELEEGQNGDSPVLPSSDQENIPPSESHVESDQYIRKCPRLQAHLGLSMMEKASNLAKKKNLEGGLQPKSQFALQEMDALKSAKQVYIRSRKRRRSLQGLGRC